MTVIKIRIKGAIKTVEFVGTHLGEDQNGVVNTHNLVLGAYTNGGADVNDYYEPIKMTQRQYNNIKALLDEETVHDADTEIVLPQTLAQLKEDIRILGSHHPDFVARFQAIEKILGMDEKPFAKWIVRKGREFQCEMADREDGVASVVLPTNYIARSEKYNDDPNDTRQLLRIVTDDLGILQVITAVQELGAIQDALNANADEPVHSAAHTVTT